MTQKEILLNKIISYEIANPNHQHFKERLMKQYTWTQSFTDRMILDYKRFMYLSVTAQHEVSPSPLIDRVWHEHLLYTKEYWNAWSDVLGKQVHHSPSTCEADIIKFNLALEKTKILYEKTFGEPMILAEELLEFPTKYSNRIASAIIACFVFVLTYNIGFAVGVFTFSVIILFFFNIPLDPNANRLKGPSSDVECGGGCGCG